MLSVKCMRNREPASIAEKIPKASSPERSQFTLTYPTAMDVAEPKNVKVVIGTLKLYPSKAIP